MPNISIFFFFFVLQKPFFNYYLFIWLYYMWFLSDSFINVNFAITFWILESLQLFLKYLKVLKTWNLLWILCTLSIFYTFINIWEISIPCYTLYYFLNLNFTSYVILCKKKIPMKKLQIKSCCLCSSDFFIFLHSKDKICME